MTCSEANQAMNAYIDGELGPVEEAAVRNHLSTCKLCQTEYSTHQSLKSSIRKTSNFSPSPEFEARMRKSFGTPPKKSRWVFPVWSFGGGAICASLVWGAILLLQPRPQTIESEILTSHIRSLMPGHMVDVVSSDRHTVGPWFSGKVPLAPQVIDLKNQQIPLLGGRLDLISGSPAAVLVYGLRNHVISLYVLRDNQVPTHRSTIRDGFNFRYWDAKGLHYIAVSDCDANALAAFQSLYESRAHS